MSPKEEEKTKVGESEEESKPKTELNLAKEKEVKVQFDNSWPRKGLVLRIKIIKESGKPDEIEMTKKNVKTRCEAAYSYLRKVLPTARKKTASLPENSLVREEADEILRKMINFMEERGLSIS